MSLFDSSPIIQNSKFNHSDSIGYVDSHAKIFLIFYPMIENSTTRIAIVITIGLCEWIKTYLAFQSQFLDNFSKVLATYNLVSFLSPFPFICVYVSWRNLLVFLHRKTYLIPKESEHWDSRMKLLFFTAQFPEGYFLPLCCHKTKGQILFSCC